jgi:hypothetical protein
MSDQRDPRIRALIVELSEASPEAPTFTEIEDAAVKPIGDGSVRPFVQSRPGRRSGWRFGAAAAAAAVVLLLVGGPLLLLRDSGDGNEVPLTPVDIETTVTDPPPTTIPATSSTEASATIESIAPEPTSPEPPTEIVESSVGVITWASAQIPRALQDIRVVDGVFVAQLTYAGPEGVEAQAVTSTDGLAWTPLESQPAWAGSFSDDAIQQTGLPYNTALVQYEGGLLSLTAFTGGELPVASWLSETGGTWSEVPIEPVSGTNQHDVSFAVGRAGAIIFAGGSDGTPYMWVLGDGGFELIDDPLINALPVPDLDVPYTDAGLAGYLRGSRLHPTESGFIAEFFIADDTGIVTAPPLRYQSSDGRDWTPVAGPDMEVWDTAVRDGVIMAVGDQGIRISSDNGSTWTQPPGTEEQRSGMIEAGPLGWIIPNGQVGIFFDSVDIQISTDATNWETILQPNGAVTGMAVDEDRIIVATAHGWDTTTYRVWVGHVTS